MASLTGHSDGIQCPMVTDGLRLTRNGNWALDGVGEREWD